MISEDGLPSTPPADKRKQALIAVGVGFVFCLCLGLSLMFTLRSTPPAGRESQTAKSSLTTTASTTIINYGM